MYRFKQETNIDFRDREKASKTIGIHRNTLGLIMRGQLTCSKMTAYCITKLLFAEAEIEDFFIREEEVKNDDKSEKVSE